MTRSPDVPAVLIATKDAESRGGVAGYYRLFFERYAHSSPRILRFEIGSRSKDYYRRTSRPVAYALDLLRDLWRLGALLRRDRSIRVVHVNPSLIPVPLLRDGLAILVARLLRRRTLVFYRGWDESEVARIDRSSVLRTLFRAVFGHADHSIVLSEGFVPPLLRWGVPSGSISVSKTMFDGRLVQMPVDRTGQPPRIVFLSRVSPLKGVGELLQAAAALHREGHQFSLDIYGHGATDTIIAELEAMAHREGLDGICRFPGFVDGPDKYAALADTDIFALPSYQEGCPNAVTEALASGAFVVSTRVGAIPELVTQDYQGSLVEPRDSQALTEALRSALENIDAIRGGALRRRAAALESFEADIIIKQVHQIYGTLLESPSPANQ
ncbi:MAG: hypothetical protein PWP23_1246 [Candidatus Sumerlaeota bacterium]|nr:hypothetical protein [Candidatus Sumerlaeota bacterium]